MPTDGLYSPILGEVRGYPEFARSYAEFEIEECPQVRGAAGVASRGLLGRRDEGGVQDVGHGADLGEAIGGGLGADAQGATGGVRAVEDAILQVLDVHLVLAQRAEHAGEDAHAIVVTYDQLEARGGASTRQAD